MKISVYGAGPIGLTTALGLCQLGHEVCCIDIDQNKVRRLQEGHVPFYEPGLSELLNKFLKNKTLNFSTNFQHGLENAVHFIAIGTPNKAGIPQLDELKRLAVSLMSFDSGNTIFIKSTVPPGTAQQIKEKTSATHGNLISHPEFLREGTALQDFVNPDRLVFGGENLDIDFLKSIYLGFVDEKFLLMSHAEAELSKYMSNAYLAQRVSFINQAAKLCEALGADIFQVKKSLSTDHRIGEKFLNAGLGFGGSCFPKDLEALTFIAQQRKIDLPLVKSTLDVNQEQTKAFVEKIETYFSENKFQKKIAFWGLSFKPNTSDLRESPALKLLNLLVESNYQIHVHDPVCKNEFLNLYKDHKNIHFFDSETDALIGANALALATEWACYQDIPLTEIKTSLNHPAIFDGRNHLNKTEALRLGFYYVGVGR